METLTASTTDRPHTPDNPFPLARLLIEQARGPGRVGLAGAAGCLVVLGVTFLPTVGHFLTTWSTDENYSHGFLVPLISLYFANEAARKGPTTVRGGLLLGSALLVVAMLGRLVTTVVPVGIVSDLSLLLGLAGVVGLIAGSDALRRYGFALFFLVFMVPLPIALYSAIASPLQLLVSRLGSALLNAIGIPVLCQGNMMTLPGDVQMFVAEACSGMRQLTGFLALTTAVAFLSSRPAWFRLVVIASSIPIALTANVLRVTLTGWIMYYINPQFAMGKYHTLEGLLMMGFGLALLAAECSFLNALVPSVSSVGSDDGDQH